VENRPPYQNGGKGIGLYGYPGVLNNCEQCHLPGTYDFSSAASQSALPNMLWSTVVAGTVNAGATNSPYFAPGAYGAAYSVANATVGNPQAATYYATLVNSPITHACFGCHDSPSAIEHMKQNGGAFFEARSTLINGYSPSSLPTIAQGQLNRKAEACLICHGSGRSADIKKVHGKF